jgi:Mg-chelatase subunit ChlD
MPNTDLTDITYIIDRSGSMQPLANDAIGGFNKFLDDQQKAPGEATLSLVLFDHEVLVPYHGVPIKEVKPLDGKTYQPRGSTALLDAVAIAIDRTGDRLKVMKEEDRPEKVMVIIMTDGHENASTDITRAELKAKIEHQEKAYSWNFVFMGANQDSFAAAVKLGIRADMAANFAPSSVGTQEGYAKTSGALLNARSAKGAVVRNFYGPKKPN